MAPLDDLNGGDAILAEFEAAIRGSGGVDPGRGAEGSFGGLVPERRAVNWVNALAALAREIEERQGPRRAEILLRSVGVRMSRELLSPLPSLRDEFEPAINRALSILDWGWVAVLDRLDTIVFEHRTPWPFEKRLDQLPFVLEGFYSDTLHRLAGNEAMQVRLTGNRGGALVFKWVQADAPERGARSQAPSVVVPEPPPSASKPASAPASVISSPEAWRQPDAPVEPNAETPQAEPVIPSAAEANLAAALEDAAGKPGSRAMEPLAADRRLPPLAGPLPGKRRARLDETPRMPVTPSRARMGTSPGTGRVLLVAGTVFVVLFVLGILSTGEMVGTVGHRLGQLVGLNSSGGRAVASDLESRALAGDTDAQIRLGLQLANATVAKPDYAAAARWFGAAAKTGSLEAQYDLGVLTTDGLGVRRDPVGAAILFMNAAAGGFPQGEYRIGAAYQHGIGVPRSASFAAMWYERAARHGVRQAQFALAGLYAGGEGLTADPVTAFAWYRLAEEEGDRAATAKRVELYRHMSMAQREAALAQAKVLIGEVGGSALTPPQPHPTVDRLIAQIS